MSQNNKPILVNNSKIMSELKSALYVEYNKTRTGIHVSSLNLCMREVVFRAIDPKSVDDREIGNYTTGRGIHQAIQDLAAYFPKYEVEKEINYEIDGITIKAHIDLYDSTLNIPIEAKTVRKSRLGTYNKSTRTWSEEEAKPFNVEQLQMYMALMDSSVGYIIYQLLLDFDNFPFRIFEVHMTKEEREKMLERMTNDAFHLQMNLDNKTPENTRHIANDPNKNWKCNYCKSLNLCYEMRMSENG
jgi:CRISPR/Cas system-associated exonuclease Cas4 (RecB family)